MMSRPVVIFTGASRGIGLAAVKYLLAEKNAIVASISRSAPPELTQLAEAHRGSLSIHQCDVANEAEFTKTISAILEKHKRLDSLVLNAAVLDPLGRITNNDISLDAWKTHFDINFFSLVPAIRSTIAALRSSNGRIIFVSSSSATGSTSAWGPYNAAKAAMNSLCRTLASEEPDITCVALHPGVVDTDMQTLIRASGSGGMDAEVHKQFVRFHTDGILLKPEISGTLMANLALRAAPSLHGQFVTWDAEECAEYRS